MLGGKKKTTRRRKPTKATKKRFAKAVIKRHFASGGSLRDFWHKHKGKLALAGLTLPTLAAAWMLFGKNTPEVLANDERIHDPIFEEEKAQNPSVDNPDFILEYAGDGNEALLHHLRNALAAQRAPKYQDDEYD